MKLWEKSALVFSVAIAAGAAIFAVTTAFYSVPVECSGFCGNQCWSSVTCILDCVCLKSDPYGWGTCVSIN